MPAVPVPEIGRVSVFVGAEDRAQQPLGLLHQRDEGGVEVADERRGQRAQHARVHVARPGAEEDAGGRGSSW